MADTNSFETTESKSRGPETQAPATPAEKAVKETFGGPEESDPGVAKTAVDIAKIAQTLPGVKNIIGSAVGSNE